MMKISKGTKVLAALAGIILVGSSMVSPANAAVSQTSDTPKAEDAKVVVPDGLDPCIDLAETRGDKLWICTAEGLSVIETSDGTEVEDFIELKSTDYTSESTKEEGGVSVRKGGDDYDTWCETGSICHREKTDYIGETKGNAAYGDKTGVLGSYDVIIKTELKGRYANTTISTYWDSGPALAFTNTRSQCLQHSTIPKICQNHSYPAATLSSASYKKKYGEVFGNELVNAGKYNYKFMTDFTPKGKVRYTAGVLSAKLFTCPKGKGTCYYP